MGNVKVQRAQPNSIYLVLHTNDPVSEMLIIILQALGVQVIFQPWQIVGARGKLWMRRPEVSLEMCCLAKDTKLKG